MAQWNSASVKPPTNAAQASSDSDPHTADFLPIHPTIHPWEAPAFHSARFLTPADALLDYGKYGNNKSEPYRHMHLTIW